VDTIIISASTPGKARAASRLHLAQPGCITSPSSIQRGRNWRTHCGESAGRPPARRRVRPRRQRAIYLRDPDHNGVELYWDRPKEQWPRAADGGVLMGTRTLNLDELLHIIPANTRSHNRSFSKVAGTTAWPANRPARNRRPPLLGRPRAGTANATIRLDEIGPAESFGKRTTLPARLPRGARQFAGPIQIGEDFRSWLKITILSNIGRMLSFIERTGEQSS